MPRQPQFWFATVSLVSEPVAIFIGDADARERSGAAARAISVLLTEMITVPFPIGKSQVQRSACLLINTIVILTT